MPIKWLQTGFLYSDRGSVVNDCKYYGVEAQSDGESVKFSKAAFLCDRNPINAVHEGFVEEKLQKLYLPEVLLLKKF